MNAYGPADADDAMGPQTGKTIPSPSTLTVYVGTVNAADQAKMLNEKDTTVGMVATEQVIPTERPTALTGVK